MADVTTPNRIQASSLTVNGEPCVAQPSPVLAAFHDPTVLAWDEVTTFDDTEPIPGQARYEVQIAPITGSNQTDPFGLLVGGLSPIQWWMGRAGSNLIYTNTVTIDEKAAQGLPQTGQHLPNGTPLQPTHYVWRVRAWVGGVYGTWPSQLGEFRWNHPPEPPDGLTAAQVGVIPSPR